MKEAELKEKYLNDMDSLIVNNKLGREYFISTRNKWTKMWINPRNRIKIKIFKWNRHVNSNDYIGRK